VTHQKTQEYQTVTIQNVAKPTVVEEVAHAIADFEVLQVLLE
jgi:hypothetical protein